MESIQNSYNNVRKYDYNNVTKTINIVNIKQFNSMNDPLSVWKFISDNHCFFEFTSFDNKTKRQQQGV